MTHSLDTTTQAEAEAPSPWQDPERPVTERVADLLGRMTLEEKVAQLGSAWMGSSGEGDGVAPSEAPSEGSVEGAPEGSPEGSADGPSDGSPD